MPCQVTEKRDFVAFQRMLWETFRHGSVPMESLGNEGPFTNYGAISSLCFELNAKQWMKMDQATYQHVWDQIRPISMFVRANIIRKPANHLVLGASTSKRSCPMLHSIWPTDNSGANREKGCSSLQLNGPPGRLLSQAAILLQFSYKGCEVLQLRSGFRDHQLLEKTGPCFMER